MIITKKALPRRTFLRGMGTTLALPLLDAMVPSMTALAATAAHESLPHTLGHSSSRKCVGNHGGCWETMPPCRRQSMRLPSALRKRSACNSGPLRGCPSNSLGDMEIAIKGSFSDVSSDGCAAASICPLAVIDAYRATNSAAES